MSPTIRRENFFDGWFFPACHQNLDPRRSSRKSKKAPCQNRLLLGCTAFVEGVDNNDVDARGLRGLGKQVAEEHFKLLLDTGSEEPVTFWAAKNVNEGNAVASVVS